jgi:hypothetical protein
MGLSCLVMTLMGDGLSTTAADLSVPGSRRWLEVRQISGIVTFQNRDARVGDRLTAVGQTITTDRRSQAVLAIDANTGVVNISENTSLRVKSLTLRRDGSRVTVLTILRGQARVQVRRLNNPNSRIEIDTPAGVAGVRGTEFGVGVSPKGKTSISTLNGQVAAIANNQTVLVNPGYSSLVIPQEPPTAPRVTPKVVLELRNLSTISNFRVRIVAAVDPLFLVFVNDKPVETQRDGTFDTVIDVPKPCRQPQLLPADRQSYCNLRVVVRSPLGEEQIYNLPISMTVTKPPNPNQDDNNKPN